jgi:AcrR family transcriptional regulator
MKQDTRDALLSTGRKIFARHGYYGASVRAITSAARSNLGAVTYHFGSKRKLYEAVLESCARPLADAAIAAAAGPGTAAQRVGAVMRVYFDYFASDINIARLLIQELVLGRTPARAILEQVSRIHDALVELVTEGQQSGEFAPGHPSLMVASIISQPMHMSLVRRVLKDFTPIDLDRPEIRERAIEHAIAFACAGLAHGGRET